MEAGSFRVLFARMLAFAELGASTSPILFVPFVTLALLEREDLRMAAFLRVYTPAEAIPSETSHAEVPVRLAELLPLVALAHRKNYLWLQDFLEDEVLISPDLYDVLQAFQQTRPSA
jgi:hypothetical protein